MDHAHTAIPDLLLISLKTVILGPIFQRHRDSETGREFKVGSTLHTHKGGYWGGKLGHYGSSRTTI